MNRIRWTAGRSGIAHAHVSGRTFCHAPSIGERYAWPELTRCSDCSRAASNEPGPLGQPGVSPGRAAGYRESTPGLAARLPLSPEAVS